MMAKRRKRGLSDVDEIDQERSPIHRFVLTGGPCAGKTTALARLSAFLRQRGYIVYTVPEAATLLFSNGATNFDESTTEQQKIEFQGTLMRLQMDLEKTFFKLAKSSGLPSVLLCDRGTMDGSAYIDRTMWDKVLNHFNMDEVELRDRRYDAVFHLVTAALGADTFYSFDTNVTRTETKAEAISLDQRLQNAWVGHSKLFVFDNSTGFENKLQRVVSCMSRLLGLPGSTKHTRKYLLTRSPDSSTFPVKAVEFEMEKVYLVADHGSAAAAVAAAAAATPAGGAVAKGDSQVLFSFVRKKMQGGFSSYSQTTVIRGADGQVIERKRIISSRTFAYAVGHTADPSRYRLQQRRISFLWNNRYYTVLEYLGVDDALNPSPVADLSLMLVQDTEHSTVRMDAAHWKKQRLDAASPVSPSRAALMARKAAAAAAGTTVAATAGASELKLPAEGAAAAGTATSDGDGSGGAVDGAFAPESFPSGGFPPFVAIDREVTSDPRYSSYYISLRDKSLAKRKPPVSIKASPPTTPGY